MDAHGLTSQPNGSQQSTPTMTEITVTQDVPSSVSEVGQEFFDEAKNGRDETTRVPGGYGSYPYIVAVTIGDDTYFAFQTNLDEDREPWHIGFRPVYRDMVLDADTLEEVEGDDAETVKSLVDLAGPLA